MDKGKNRRGDRVHRRTPSPESLSSKSTSSGSDDEKIHPVILSSAAINLMHLQGAKVIVKTEEDDFMGQWPSPPSSSARKPIREGGDVPRRVPPPPSPPALSKLGKVGNGPEQPPVHQEYSKSAEDSSRLKPIRVPRPRVNSASSSSQRSTAFLPRTLQTSARPPLSQGGGTQSYPRPRTFLINQARRVSSGSSSESAGSSPSPAFSGLSSPRSPTPLPPCTSQDNKDTDSDKQGKDKRDNVLQNIQCQDVEKTNEANSAVESTCEPSAENFDSLIATSSQITVLRLYSPEAGVTTSPWCAWAPPVPSEQRPTGEDLALNPSTVPPPQESTMDRGEPAVTPNRPQTDPEPEPITSSPPNEVPFSNRNSSTSDPDDINTETSTTEIESQTQVLPEGNILTSDSVETADDVHILNMNVEESEAEKNSCWREGKSAGERFLHVWSAPEFRNLHDVKFEVGPTKEVITAHRLVLTVHSDYLTKVMSESNLTEPILFPDLDPRGFKAFLTNLYSGHVEITTVELAFEIFKCAKILEHEELAEVCKNYLCSNLSVENAVKVYCFGKTRQLKKLEDEALCFMNRESLDVVVSSEGFLILAEDDVCQFLESDAWFLDEIKVFKAIKRWATRKFFLENPLETKRKLSGPELRLAMGNAFYGIRFPLFSFRQLTTVNREHKNLLEDFESNLLYQFICANRGDDQEDQAGNDSEDGEGDTTTPPPPPIFCSRPRQNTKKNPVPRPTSELSSESNNSDLRPPTSESEQVDSGRTAESLIVDETSFNVEFDYDPDESKEKDQTMENDSDKQVEPDVGIFTQFTPEDVAIDNDEESFSNKSGANELSNISHPKSVFETSALLDTSDKAEDSDVSIVWDEPPKKRVKHSILKKKSSAKKEEESKVDLTVSSTFVNSSPFKESISRSSEPCQVTVTLNHYISTLSTRLDPRTVTVINVTVELNVPHGRVWLPSLKEFHLTLAYKRDKTLSCGSARRKLLKRYFASFNKILFFDVESHDPTQLDKSLTVITKEVMNRRVNISVHIFGATILKICHDTGTLVMNMLLYVGNEIIENCDNFPFRTLAVNECDISSLKHIRKDLLEVLILRRIGGGHLRNRGKFLEACPALRQLAWDSMDDDDICLMRHLFQTNPGIEKLALSKCRLSFPATPWTGCNLRELYVEQCRLLMENMSFHFPTLFPLVEKVHVFGTFGRRCDSHLLHHILEMPSIRWICCWELHYCRDTIGHRSKKPNLTPESIRVRNLLLDVFGKKEVGRTTWESRPRRLNPTFILRRKNEPQPASGSAASSQENWDPFDPNAWEGELIPLKDKYDRQRKLEFEHFSCDYFFDNFPLFDAKFQSSRKSSKSGR